MGDDYQLRKDIDKVLSDLYDYNEGLKVPLFKEGSPLKYISTQSDEEEQRDAGTIDAILEYYGLIDIDEKVDGKSDIGHTHTLSEITDYEDISWTNVSFESGYSNYPDSATVQYQRKGNVVELSGVWTTSAERDATTSPVVFCTIPSSVAPSKPVRVRCQGSQANDYLLTIDTSGNVGWSRYGAGTNSNLPKDVWGIAHAVWII